MRMYLSPHAVQLDAEEDVTSFPGYPEHSEAVIHSYFGSW